MTSAADTHHYLIVSGLLFALGIAGVIIRRNALVSLHGIGNEP